MTGPMWAVLGTAVLTLAAGLTAAVRTVRRTRPPRPAASLAHQWASQALEPRPGRHVRLNRTGRWLIAAACGAALVAVGSVATLALTTGKRPPQRFAVALSGQPADEVAYGPRIVSEDAGLCLTATDRPALTLAACDGSAVQRFSLAADGTIRLGTHCLAAERATALQLVACAGGPAQKFSMESGRLASRSAGTCADVADGRVVAGAGIVLRDCDDVASRHWWYLAS